MEAIKSAEDIAKVKAVILKSRHPEKPCITICNGTGCHAYGCLKVTEAFKKEIQKRGLKGKIDLRATGCHGFCERGPIVVIQPEGLFYQRVELEDVKSILDETIENKKIIDKLLYVDPKTKEKIKLEKDVPFYKKQQRLIFGMNGMIEPTSIEDYIAVGGYEALGKALTAMSSDQIIQEIIDSGLRGRGGAGFPTGYKWRFARKAPGEKKYIICNADEGDPGAYMDRSLLEGNPHSVIEGMIIGAYAIGANEGVIYVRQEYPLAVKNAQVAIDQAKRYGFLGENILDRDFSFDIKISRGAGAFVSGEETGLIASVEGRKGEPRQRPPFPAIQGLWGKPTNINNVETWATIPPIINRGAAWFAGIGTEKSKGTKIFSLVGKINNTGLVEVPMGMTLREIVFDIGGGIPGGKEFKAVQTGGPSGGCMPKELLDMPVDFEKLTEAGSMMGSGGMIVMDEDTCMVDVAKYFLTFLLDESCGKCFSCRVGIDRMLEIVTDITEGKGTMEQLELLEELAETVAVTTLCGLGQTAPNPVLSTLRYFRSEYEAHVKAKRCPAGVCRALITYAIDPEKCNGCLLCREQCPEKAISGEKKKVHVIDKNKCTRCGICMDVCKQDAVRLI
jgi:NADH:ubiquinone oxidoreductase subunit F (NADH-binding)/(2Fe-2S) ferredoxin/NAD-dependent dihydropyrimidine dehydrogenase PreA subunit